MDIDHEIWPVVMRSEVFDITVHSGDCLAWRCEQRCDLTYAEIDEDSCLDLSRLLQFALNFCLGRLGLVMGHVLLGVA